MIVIEIEYQTKVKNEEYDIVIIVIIEEGEVRAQWSIVTTINRDDNRSNIIF